MHACMYVFMYDCMYVCLCESVSLSVFLSVLLLFIYRPVPLFSVRTRLQTTALNIDECPKLTLDCVSNL